MLTLLFSFRAAETTGQISSYFYGTNSMTVLMTSASVFLLFRRALEGFTPGSRLGRAIASLSSCSFGVYLVHLFIIERTFPLLPSGSPALIPFIPAIALIVYAASAAAALLLRRIPVIGKMIT